MPPSKAYLVGLTGGIASGKSHLARALREAGAWVVDADEIAASLTGEGGRALPLIREAFGGQVFAGARLDRKALAARIFESGEDRGRLNAIMHPMMLAEVEEKRRAAAGERLMILEAALLYEAGWDRICNEVWCAYIPRLCQILRVMRRDGLGFRRARQRVDSQMPSSQKRRRADHSIPTWGSRRRSAARALRLWRQALRRVEGAGNDAP